MSELQGPMPEPQGRSPGRTLKIDEEEFERAREKFRGMLRPDQRLGNLTPNELVVLLSDVSAELIAQGGSPLIPVGIQQRLARAGR